MRTSRGAMAATLLLAASAGLVACAPAAPDPDEVGDWLSEHTDEDHPGALATLGGMAEAGKTPADDKGVTFTFDEPAVVTGVEFSCFGAETMSVTIAIDGDGTATSTGHEDLRCDESPHEIGQMQNGATSVRANASNPDGRGAWVVVVLGGD